jgi:hypothetical protein
MSDRVDELAFVRRQGEVPPIALHGSALPFRNRTNHRP